MSCRKKIDSKFWIEYTQTMESEVRTLKQELARTRDALKIATKRCRDLVRELDSRSADHESERCLRDQQLSRILRALLVLESRLKQEQKSIRQLLCEKDNVIRNQQLEIAKLRRYTKNYIKTKREQNRNSQPKHIISENPSTTLPKIFTNSENNRCLETSIITNDSTIEYIDNLQEIRDSELGKDIQRLKREIIDKLNVGESDDDSARDHNRHINNNNNKKDYNRRSNQSCNQDRSNVRQTAMYGVRKTDSFAGSDVSKESCASSSENADAVSILTTTTDESCPSLLSTEGFCEGESTDVSPGSTLDKFSMKSSKSIINEIGARSCDRRDLKIENLSTNLISNDTRERTNDDELFPKRRHGILRTEPLVLYGNDDGEDDEDEEKDTKVTIVRTESKDDGMDCNFASEDEDNDVNDDVDDEGDDGDDDDDYDDIRGSKDKLEPIYVNACSENNARNMGECTKKTQDLSSGKQIKENCFVDTSNKSSKIDQEEDTGVEETSGNWYSDPDEDRISDDVFRHSTYRPNSNHNSVLECVNQILLRDMEDEESMLTAPRRFKHRGRIVRFQPARLSDIESVGSEMERRNSEDGTTDRDNAEDTNEIGNFEATGSEDEFGMRIDNERECGIVVDDSRSETIQENESQEETAAETEAAIPIVVIEPKIERIETGKRILTSSLEIGGTRTRNTNRSSSPTLRMERIEEKTCLQMSTKGLTIAKNLDYEDIESLPDLVTPTAPKTPPALPPKPTQFRNTLILKKIPSPSFLIDETRSKHNQSRIDVDTSIRNIRGISNVVTTPIKTVSNGGSSRSLVFEDKNLVSKPRNENGNNFTQRNRFVGVRSSFQTVDQFGNDQSSLINKNGESIKVTPRVTSMVRHFEEFKIGGDNDDTNLTRKRSRSHERRLRHTEFEDFDMRQNFEEFNLDDCDLSDDPDRPDGDGSERLVNTANIQSQSENKNVDNNNIIYNTSSNNANGIYDNFLEATGLSNKSILTPSRLLSNHKSMLKPKDVKYKNKIKANAVLDKQSGIQQTGNNAQFTHVRHWTGPFV